MISKLSLGRLLRRRALCQFYSYNYDSEHLREVQKTAFKISTYVAFIRYPPFSWIKHFVLVLDGNKKFACCQLGFRSVTAPKSFQHAQQTIHSFCHSFRFAQGTNKLWKMLCPSTLWFIILSRNSNTLQSTEGEVANLFRPRIVICAVILTSTNKWDIEPGLLSLVINHVYSVAVWQSMLLFPFY